MTRGAGDPPLPSSRPLGPPGPVPNYIERQTFRRRRLIDSACALPLLGWVLWWLPLFWHQAETPIPASQVLIYIFGIWLGLALTAARLVRLLDRTRGTGTISQDPGP